MSTLVIFVLKYDVQTVGLTTVRMTNGNLGKKIRDRTNQASELDCPEPLWSYVDGQSRRRVYHHSE